MNRPHNLSSETLAAQGIDHPDPAFHGIVPPIYPATAYEAPPTGAGPTDRAYTRADNPSYDSAEHLLSALEGGAGCILFASGSAATSAIFQALIPGDHVLVARVLYWGIRKWLAEFAVTWGLHVEFVDTTDPAAVAAAIRPGRTRLLWLETPANPTWEVSDLAALCDIARVAGVRVAVDSTVATPVLTRPIEFGADLVVHSATKYLNGHSDVLAGAIVTARRDPFWERLRSVRRNGGAVLGPFEAWLLQRGMRTLFLRVRRSSETALALARHFRRHPQLTAVLYPGLPDHPGHAIAARQMTDGFGGMLSIRVRGGEAAAKAVAAATRVFRRTTSLGGVESLIEHRRSTEGPSSPVPGDLLRLSIGLEAFADLAADLESALAATSGRPRPAPTGVGPPDRPADDPDPVNAPSGGAARSPGGSADPVPGGSVAAPPGAGEAGRSLPAGGVSQSAGSAAGRFGGTLGISRPAGLGGSSDPAAVEAFESPVGAVAEHRPASGQPPLSDEASSLANRIASLLERSLGPLVIARGGAIRLIDAGSEIIALEVSGSPGAVIPLFPEVEAQVRAGFPDHQVRLVWPGQPAESSVAGLGSADVAGSAVLAEPVEAPHHSVDPLAARVCRILDEVINPAVAEHGGRVTLVNATNGIIRLSLSGGCQGCAQAEVTVRQGIEPLLRERLPEIIAVVDVTDHQAGREPYFPPAKR